ncbi:MAG: ATP-binding cassette domain-containing protein, partial [Pseudomonadales bacterium]
MSTVASNHSSQAPQQEVEPVLVLDSVSCERGDRLLVENLSLSLSPGNGIRIEGPNGSGKTTLLRVLAGLSQQYRGT